jgi:carboxyl-terminal processing protease
MKRTNTHPRKNLRPFTLVSLLAFAIGLTIFSVRPTEADLGAPGAQERQVSIAVSSFLNRDHVSRRELDDEISERALDMYLKMLDPMKIYFVQSDVDHFAQWRTKLDDMVKAGNVQFAHTVYKTYLERLDERMTEVQKLIKADHDFKKDEFLGTDFDNRKWPKNAAEANERWRKRVKYDLLGQKAAKTDIDEAREKLRKRYRTFAQNRKQADNEEVLEIYLSAVTTSYDPHTSYMSKTTFENFLIQMRLQLEGIGAALQMLDGDTVVTKIIRGGAAHKDGRLSRDDHITGVGQGADGEITDTAGMRLNDVVQMIRGHKGTIVRLRVQPKGKGEAKTYDITRAKIELKDSEARGEIIEDGKKANGAPYRVGVINLPSFYMDMEAARKGKPDFRSTTRDVKKLLARFNEAGVDAVIVDLRLNGGGSLTEAINMTGLFIEKGPVVQVKDADGQVQHYDDLDPSITWKGPLVVMIDKFSASASEIFAGAIQDYRRGLVVGDHATHGKGTVQTLLDVGRQLFRLPNSPKLGALKITMQQFYRPNGDSTQNRGVVSDIELPSVKTHMDVGESDLDYAVKFDRVPAVKFKSSGQIDQVMIGQMKKRSEQRRAGSEDFKKTLDRIAKYKSQKERKSISLNEEKFLAERKSLDGDEKEDDEKEDDEDPVVKRDYYFNEALAITIDYIQLLSSGNIAAAAK